MFRSVIHALNISRRRCMSFRSLSPQQHKVVVLENKSQLASREIWVISCFLPVKETEPTAESSCLSCPEDRITLMRRIHSMKYVKYDVEFQYYFEYTQKYRSHQIKNLPLLLKTEGDHFILSWNIAGSGLINCVFRSYPRYCSDCQAYN